MHFSNETVNILKNFSNINNNIMFKKGTSLSTVSPNKSIIGIANISENIDRDFGIFDLNKFIGVLSLFDNPDVKLSDKYATISEGTRKIRYSFAAPNMITQVPGIPSLPDPELEFALDGKTISTLLKTASIMKLDMFELRGDGTNISFAVVDSKKATDDEFTIVVAETDKAFKMKILPEDFKVFETDYTVYVNMNGLIQFKNDNLHYFVMGKVD